jgi:hypothetical protein
LNPKFFAGFIAVLLPLYASLSFWRPSLMFQPPGV